MSRLLNWHLLLRKACHCEGNGQGSCYHYLWGALTHGSTPTLREAVHILKSVMTVAGAKKHDLFIWLGRQGWRNYPSAKHFFSACVLVCLIFGIGFFCAVNSDRELKLHDAVSYTLVCHVWGFFCFHSHWKWSLWIICSLFSGVFDLKYHHVISFSKGTNKICPWNEQVHY